MAVVRVLSPFVARVMIANPLQVKASALAKTDKIDAGVLGALARGLYPQQRTPPRRSRSCSWRPSILSRRVPSSALRTQAAISPDLP